MLLTINEELELLELLEYEQLAEIPPKLEPLRKPKRYNIIHGGRGSTKSWTVDKLLVERATINKLKMLFTREIQDSLKESVYDLTVAMIDRLKLPGWWIKEKEIINKRNGSKITFKGLRDIRAAKQLMSYEGYDIAWVEQAESVSEDSWQLLTPTIRKKGSEIWATFNRFSEFDPVYQLYCVNPRPNSIVIEINWRDNPWFHETELPAEMEYDKKYDYDLYLWKWENYPIAQIERAIMLRRLVDGAVRRNIKKPEGAIIIGADIARFGTDKIVFYKRKGLKIIDKYIVKKQDTMTTSKDLAGFSESIYTQIKIDDTGVGGGVTDRMKELGFKNIIPINFGSTPKDKDKYNNVISEMWFEAKSILEKADIPNDKDLIQELTGRQFSYDIKQRRCVESKDKFKERYKRSPDNADALLLCFYDSGSILKMSQDRSNEMAKRRQKDKKRRRGLIV